MPPRPRGRSPCSGDRREDRGLCDRLVGQGPFSRRGCHCVSRKIRPTASEHQVGPCVPTINQDQGLIQRPAALQRSGGRAKNMRENVFFLLRAAPKTTTSGAAEGCVIAVVKSAIYSERTWVFPSRGDRCRIKKRKTKARAQRGRTLKVRDSEPRVKETYG